jgi:iron complex outermembrane receptor protein
VAGLLQRSFTAIRLPGGGRARGAIDAAPDVAVKRPPRQFVLIAAAGASALVWITPARAQVRVTAAAPPPLPAGASAEPATLAEIIVTARRKSESLQSVPQTVNVVTADTLQQLKVIQFTDLQLLVPGLSLATQNGSSYQAAASLRGVSFDVTSGAQPSVAMYINDAPIPAVFLFSPLLDVGQIEVLRGPQGATRGVSAPSGAITLTSHMPDLTQNGGYLDALATDQNGRNAQGALNVAMIKDVLALRVAGLIDQNDYNGVRSIHNNVRPRQVTSSERVSVSFEPTPMFNARVAYWHLDQALNTFDQVSGPGQGTLTNPPILPDQRVAVEDGVSGTRTHFDVVTAQLDSRLFGQDLQYVGSYQHAHIRAEQPGDAGNFLPGVEFYSFANIGYVATTHEVRLASDPNPARGWDYAVGAFYGWLNPTGQVSRVGPLLPGAFGATPEPNLAAFNPAYQIPFAIDFPSTLQQTSVFASVNLHLGSKTELSGGVRHIWSVVDNRTLVTQEDGLLNLGALGVPPGVPCAALRLSAGRNAGDCVVPTAAVSDRNDRSSETPSIYSVSLSHHVGRDVLAYANTGTSYRPPIATVGILGALAESTDPTLQALTSHPSERSRSYEVGVKATFLGGRARVNASAFRQTFRNLTIVVPNVNYLNTAFDVVAPFDFTASVDARVTGFDIDSAFQINRYWSMSAQLSYADGKVQGSLVPCNAPGANGPFNTTDPTSGLALISLCPGGSVSRLPLWNAVLETEYARPVANLADGFVRVLLTYYPENKNRAEPNFTVDKYSLLNLYTGVRSQDGAWEVSLFARNALRTQRLLNRSPVAFDANGQLQANFSGLIPASGSGYFATTVTPRREAGVSVHYAWGSR